MSNNNLAKISLFANPKTKIKMFNDNFQNYKRYGIPKAQLVIADIPYNLGNSAFASSRELYKDGVKQKHLLKKAFFHTDYNFNIAEFFHFASKMLKKEPKEVGKAPAMIVFCSFEQAPLLIEQAKKYGFKNYYPLYFIKNNSAQVLKVNKKIIGGVENGLVFYKEKLPKFNNNGKMILNWFKFVKDSKDYPKIHPTQKPVNLIAKLVRIFTDEGDTVIDPVAGSGSTLRACMELDRHAYGFEISKEFYKKANELMLLGGKK